MPFLPSSHSSIAGLFAADIGAGAVMDVDVERPAVDVVLADQPGLVGLVDRRLQALALEDVFAAHVDVGGVGAHREAGDQAALDQRVRIVAQDLAVLAGAGLGFVGVDDEIMRPLGVDDLGHERPFQAGREARAAAAAQARGLHLVDDPVAALVDDRLGAVPVAARPRALQAAIAEAVEIGEDAVLVLEHRSPFSAFSAFGRRRRRSRRRRRRASSAPSAARPAGSDDDAPGLRAGLHRPSGGEVVEQRRRNSPASGPRNSRR